MRSKKKFDPDSLTFAPFTLIPSTFPKIEFDKAVKLQPILNELVHRVAHSHVFLEETLKKQVTSFVFRLLTSNGWDKSDVNLNNRKF